MNLTFSQILLLVANIRDNLTALFLRTQQTIMIMIIITRLAEPKVITIIWRDWSPD